MSRTKPSVNLLIVEDNPADARMVVEVLREVGVLPKVRVAQTGPEGLAMLLGNWADVALIDINLPAYDGHELMEKYLTLGRGDTVFIAMSSSDRDSDRIKAVHNYCIDYVTKVTGLEEFGAEVRDHLVPWLRRLQKGKVKRGKYSST